MNVKQAQAKDISCIEKMYKLKVQELAQKGLKQWEEDEITWAAMSQDYDISDFYIVYQKDEAVGCFCVVDYDPTYWLNDKPKQALYIHKVMVLNKASASGVSDYILDVFKELGKARGMECVKLDVRAHKEKLRSYYERNGFELVEIVDLKHGYLTALYRFNL